MTADLGTAWLGSVPEHWDVSPGRALFVEVDDRDHPGEELLSVTISRGVIEQRTLLAAGSKKDSSNEDKTAYKLVRPGEIAYNKMRAWQGAVGLSAHRGIVSPAYIVMRPRGECVREYFHYLLRTAAFAKEAERWSYGISSDQWSLRPEHFKMIRFPLPPVGEQASIVRFLDHADRRIRRAIHTKQTLIALLNEEKQAVIHRAVTRGLDPQIRLKSSGVDWLGDVPMHWEVRRLRDSVLGFVGGVWGDEPNGHDDMTCVRVADFDRAGLRVQLTRPTMRAVKKGERRHRMLKRGDLLLEKSGGGDQQPVGAVVLYDHDVPAVCSNFVARMSVAAAFDSSFLCYLHSHLYATRLNVRSIKQTTGIQNLHASAYLAEPVAFPPLSEQVVIAQFLDDAAARWRRAADNTKREILLLDEYRTRLIADVVTGKLDVRGVAARLAHEVEEQEPLNHLDAEEDAEMDVEDSEPVEA